MPSYKTGRLDTYEKQAGDSCTSYTLTTALAIFQGHKQQVV